MNLKVLCFVALGIVLLSLFISKTKENMHETQQNKEQSYGERSYGEQSYDQSHQSTLNQNLTGDSMYVATPDKPRPTQRNVINQYSNPYFSAREQHPVLAYQYAHDKGINPANIGDPIRIPMISGPTGLYGEPSNFASSLIHSRGSIPIEQFGPFSGKPQGVPVPANSLKYSNEAYNPDIFRYAPPHVQMQAPQQPIIENKIVPLIEPGTNFPYQVKPSSAPFFKPYGPNMPIVDVPFVGSVNAYAPFPEVQSSWEKVGILTSKENAILNLYRRAIAPAQNLWEYQVQDKNGFVISLRNVKYVEDGDLIEQIPGKAGMGPWKVHDFVQDKYIWV
jgi:hypothetical protein